jgi:hypothetical protein
MIDLIRVHAGPRRVFWSCCSLIACALGVLDASAQPVLWVQNYGIDQAGCGTKSVPCRSLARAVGAAPSGAVVLVGPGRYGDVNRNGSVDPGDETSVPSDEFWRGVIRVERPIRIYSTHGAEVTTIDISSYPLTLPRAVVAIRANDVQFGRRGGGFRMFGPEDGANGAEVTFSPEKPVRNVRVSGNIIEGRPVFGQLYFGSGISLLGAHHSVLLTDNVISGKATGIWVVLADSLPGNATYGPVTVQRNILRHNHTGADLVGRGITFTDNVVDSNRGDAVTPRDVLPPNDTLPPPGTGIVILNNYLVNNSGGLRVGVVESFRRNFVVANWTGIQYVMGAWSGRVEQNNIFGNSLPAGFSPSPSNCGVVVNTSMIADVRNNYWGAATGPGPDPADYSGGDGIHCLNEFFFPRPQSIDTPFATTPFAVPAPFHPGAPRG